MKTIGTYETKNNPTEMKMNPMLDEPMNWKDYSTTAASMDGPSWGRCPLGPSLAGWGSFPVDRYPGIGMALTGLAGGKKGSILEDMVTKLAGAMKKRLRPGRSSIGKMAGGDRVFAVFLMILLIPMFTIVPGCASGLDHPLLQSESRAAMMDVATPYILTDCSAVEMYPGFRFAWNQVDPSGDSAYRYGFGGIVGGCGSYAKVSCMVQKICNHDPGGGNGGGNSTGTSSIEAGNSCSSKVICEVVEVLDRPGGRRKFAWRSPGGDAGRRSPTKTRRTIRRMIRASVFCPTPFP